MHELRLLGDLITTEERREFEALKAKIWESFLGVAPIRGTLSSLSPIQIKWVEKRNSKTSGIAVVVGS